MADRVTVQRDLDGGEVERWTDEFRAAATF
jgi:hypothetical protein